MGGRPAGRVAELRRAVLAGSGRWACSRPSVRWFGGRGCRGVTVGAYWRCCPPSPALCRWWTCMSRWRTAPATRRSSPRREREQGMLGAAGQRVQELQERGERLAPPWRRRRCLRGRRRLPDPAGCCCYHQSNCRATTPPPTLRARCTTCWTCTAASPVRGPRHFLHRSNHAVLWWAQVVAAAAAKVAAGTRGSLRPRPALPPKPTPPQTTPHPRTPPSLPASLCPPLSPSICAAGKALDLDKEDLRKRQEAQ